MFTGLNLLLKAKTGTISVSVIVHSAVMKQMTLQNIIRGFKRDKKKGEYAMQTRIEIKACPRCRMSAHLIGSRYYCLCGWSEKKISLNFSITKSDEPCLAEAHSLGAFGGKKYVE